MKRLSAVLVVLWGVAGCGSGGPVDYPVSGTASWEGKPIPTGHVIFYPADSSGVSPDAGAITNGTFNFRAKPGPKRIEIRADRDLGPPDKYMGGTPREPYIPPCYNDKTILAAEVPVGGKSDFSFTLTKDCKK